jgi:hypothetical protein
VRFHEGQSGTVVRARPEASFHPGLELPFRSENGQHTPVWRVGHDEDAVQRSEPVEVGPKFGDRDAGPPERGNAPSLAHVVSYWTVAAMPAGAWR